MTHGTKKTTLGQGGEVQTGQQKTMDPGRQGFEECGRKVGPRRVGPRRVGPRRVGRDRIWPNLIWLELVFLVCFKIWVCSRLCVCCVRCVCHVCCVCCCCVVLLCCCCVVVCNVCYVLCFPDFFLSSRFLVGVFKIFGVFKKFGGCLQNWPLDRSLLDGPSAGQPKISLFFFLARPHFRSFSLSLWGSSRGILVVFLKTGTL